MLVQKAPLSTCVGNVNSSNAKLDEVILVYEEKRKKKNRGLKRSFEQKMLLDM